jgi:uncharacterized membrane protein YphA (DoxX/SURF4 family)
MIEFRDFVARHGFPMPMFSARLSAYGQFLAGILLALGLFTRPTSIVVIINFIAALAMVHVGLPFNANIAPMAAGGRAVLRDLRRARVLRDAVLAQRQSPLPAKRGEG